MAKTLRSTKPSKKQSRVRSGRASVGGPTAPDDSGDSDVLAEKAAGSGGPNMGHNPTVGSLDRVRVDFTDRTLTTNQGVPSRTTSSADFVAPIAKHRHFAAGRA
jgi:hypothetical protein